jgi:hypothetical protein
MTEVAPSRRPGASAALRKVAGPHMNTAEKKHLLQQLNAKEIFREAVYYEALEQLGDLKYNYTDYLITEPIDCEQELRRLPQADYELCTALLTMLLREDHFDNGSFGRRCQAGQVQPIIDRMILLLG